MSIERLNKAASAAGFAMATPDEDAGGDLNRTEVGETEPSRALAVIATPAQRPSLTDTIVGTATGWLKNHLPTFNGRQPA